MKRIIIILLAIISINLNISELRAETPSYDIMRQIAAEQFSVQSAAGVKFQFPQQWKLDGAHFVVPYHQGIAGGFIAETKSSEEVVLSLKSLFGAEFDVISSEKYVAGQITGEKYILTGRPGGRIWRALVFTGTTKNSSKPIFFYAMTPEAWFSTYQIVFMKIIDTME